VVGKERKQHSDKGKSRPKGQQVMLVRSDDDMDNKNELPKKK
jgi:hypothetical protein